MAETARQSVGSRIPAKSLEVQHNIRLIQEMNMEIGEIEVQIETMMVEIHSPIITIPGIGIRMTGHEAAALISQDDGFYVVLH
jgi:hypothetical protein